MLGRIDVIADGIAARLVGSRDPGTLGGLYLAFDAVVFLTALQLRNLIRLVRRAAGAPRHKSRFRLIAWEIVLPVWRELLVPVGILVGLPGVLSAPWVNLAKTDAGAWLLALAVLLVATGGVRAVRTRSAWLSPLRRVRSHHRMLGTSNSQQALS